MLAREAVRKSKFFYRMFDEGHAPPYTAEMIASYESGFEFVDGVDELGAADEFATRRAAHGFAAYLGRQGICTVNFVASARGRS